MGPRQWFLTGVFAVHLVVFLWFYHQRRRWTRLFPVGVFVLLILTQVFWNSTAEVQLGGGDPILLRTAFRHSAWTLAVPSLALMFRRIYLHSARSKATS